MDIQDYFGKHLYFIGIGGSSMSGLARLMSWHGCKVSGSDRTANHKTDALKEIGVTIYVGHEGKNVAGSDLVIYSAAIPETNPERVFAKENNIPQIERCTLIGLIMAHYGNAIAISGTHGKTTTTAMMAQVFMAAGEDPTIHIGGEFPALGGSTRLGEGEIGLGPAKLTYDPAALSARYERVEIDDDVMRREWNLDCFWRLILSPMNGAKEWVISFDHV